MKNELLYFRITFEDYVKFASPGEASYEIINYFATKVANDRYTFAWNAKTEFITEKFISMEENFSNNSIDMLILNNDNIIEEIELIIKELLFDFGYFIILNEGELK